MSNIDDFVIENGVLKDYCGNDRDVVIPDSVTSIGNLAFFDCKKLKSITIPDGVTIIGNSAFCDCKKLKSITIPDGVTNIGTRAFCDCKKLKSITIPDGVTSIGDSAFNGCKNLKSIIIPDGVTIIGDSAFWDCKKLKSITIPDGVTNIGAWVFCDCKKLKSITIPDGVTNIGAWAFCDCKKLKSITIPDGVTNIGDWAFEGCKKLKSITIPDSVTSIGKYALGNNRKFTIYGVPGSAAEEYAKENGINFCNYKFEKIEFVIKNGLLEKYYGEGGDVVVPDGVTSVGEGAFQNCLTLTSVKLPDSVTSVGDGAFCGCEKLVSVNLPDGITNVGNNVFAKCKNLTSIIFPDGITSIGDRAFQNCINLTSVRLPDSVTCIGKRAFCGCEKLSSITIPEGVVSIGEGAFRSCAGLTELLLPSTLKTIGDYELYTSDKGVRELVATLCEEKEALFEILYKEIFRLILEDGGEICARAFYDYLKASEHNDVLDEKLPEYKDGVMSLIVERCDIITLGKFFEMLELSEEELDRYIEMTGKCYEVRVLLLEQKAKINDSPELIDEIQKLWGQKILTFVREGSGYAVSEIKGDLPTVIIPERYKNLDVTEVTGGALRGHKNLEDIFIPATVTKIGMGAFRGCKDFTIHAPDRSYAQQYAKKKGIPFELVEE